MFGAYIWGSFADTRGRIPALILCQACNGLFIVGSSVSQSLWFLILMRFLSGLGEGGTVPLVYTYVIELLPVKRRARMTAILSSTYMIGQTGIAGLAWLVLPHTEWTWRISNFTFNYWRIFLLISSVPIILSLFLFMLFPESPRYLVQVNKIAQAKSVIRYMFRKNQPKKAYDSTYTIQCEVEGESTNSIAALQLNSYYGLTMWFPTMIQRMDESKATSVCAVTSLTSNKTLCDFSDETKVYFDTFLQAAANLPGHLIYFLLVNSVGRKPIIGVSMVLTAISVFFIWLVSSPTGSIVMSCVFAGVTIVTWDAIALVTVEIFPLKSDQLQGVYRMP
ncbi:hypothetical protein EB796_022344 [Bugula neritina]|uniref:Major facilitator superfamily (MFS) profile domain-containing protein n=1 Tax=Bugula neritina TaxID=10212 RepID=A0A7J7J0M2_BUGNE|nr:hypothetical protein EB796_022344 [Bugula neritina]